MFSKQKTIIILSLFVIFSLVQHITCADTEPVDPAKPSEPAAASNVVANNPESAKITNSTPIVSVASQPTTTEQSSTTPTRGTIFCNMIYMPFKFIGEQIESFWRNLLKFRDNIISAYRPLVSNNTVVR